MNKKILLTLILALSIIGIASAITYASRDIANSTKNKVVTVNDKSNKINKSQATKGKISDEEVVKIATRAMKDYIGLDAIYFANTKITRVSAKETRDAAINQAEILKKSYSKEDFKMLMENANKITDNLIYVQFTLVNKSTSGRDLVSVDEKTGELVVVDAFNNIDVNLKGRINDSKVNKATLNFFKQIRKSINYSTIRVDKNIEDGTINVIGTLDDGRGVSIILSLKNYSVIGYRLNYNNVKRLPSQEKQHKEKFRELRIK